MTIGFGITQGPNGPQMTTVWVPTPAPSAPAEPESYESHLETPEGVHVRLTYFTKNKATADRLADEAGQKMGWKVLDKAPEPPAVPKTRGDAILEAWATAFVLDIVGMFAAFIIAFMFHMASYLSFNELTDWGSFIVRVGLWTFPFAGLFLSAVACFTHSSDKTHD